MCFMQDCHFVSCLITYITLTILVSKDFCHLLITFANSKDPDLEQKNVDPDLDPKGLTL